VLGIDEVIPPAPVTVPAQVPAWTTLTN
jgi:hypothetical protein